MIKVDTCKLYIL